jgi:hypothetical protein
MKTLFLALAIAATSLAQVPPANPARFAVTSGDVSLSAATTAVTVQKPALNGSPQPQVRLESATVYCSVACNVSQAYNGTAATSTAATVTQIPPIGGASPSATGWTASNVGGGTAVGALIHVAAGQTLVIDLSKVTLNGNGTNANYTVSVSSITGTANITLIWSEQ